MELVRDVGVLLLLMELARAIGLIPEEWEGEEEEEGEVPLVSLA